MPLRSAWRDKCATCVVGSLHMTYALLDMAASGHQPDVIAVVILVSDGEG